MQLSLQNFSTMLSNAAAAVQASATQLIDLSVGSVLRAVLEANAALGMWLQWLIVEVLATTRAATSNGADLDSFMADFGVERLPASPASGVAQFSRFTPTATALITLGTLVKTADGTQSFAVTQDTTNAAWSTVQSGYLLGNGIASITLPITSNTAGSAGNVQPGAISLIATAIAGIDTVTNTLPTSGGMDAESDSALRARFSTFLSTRSRGTPLAIANAINSVRQGLTFTVQENTGGGGAVTLGCFVVTVDDGSGAPPSALLASIGAAVEAVRPVGSIYTIQGPIVITANVSMAITTLPSANHAAVVGIVGIAVAQAIDALPVGESLPWSRLTQIAYVADPSVINVSGVLLNGGTADLSLSPNNLLRPGVITVS